jgi:protoheme ferro-lyase
MLKLAEVLSTTPNYLMGWKNSKSTSAKLSFQDEKDLQQRLESIVHDLNSPDSIAMNYGGIPLNETAQEILRASIENVMQIAKLATKSYTKKQATMRCNNINDQGL